MQSWQSRLSDRKTQFLGKTREKLVEINVLLDQLAAQPHDRERLHALNKFFHQLAGGGGIYEMKEFCSVAISAEEICTKLIANSAPLGQIEHQKLQSQCAMLRQLIEEEAGRPTGPIAAQPMVSVTGSSGSSRKPDVLLVDQNSDRLISWHRVFEENKMAVRTVKSASGARGALLTRIPDVLVINAPLPDSLLGLEVIKQMRSLPAGHNSIALVISDNASFKAKIEAIKSGADSFIDGPADVKEILLKAQEFICREKPAQHKILSVEDDPEQAFFIKSTLESAGYAVLHIADPAEFEDAINSYAPDLVLLDIMLGDISGHDLARFLRKHKSYSKLPIVFLTTENQLSMHLESARVGGDEHLVKPVPPQLLVATIAGKLERQGN